MHTIFDMDTLVHTPIYEGDETPVGAAELVKGKFGKACRFNFVEESRRGYFTAPVAAGPEWDQAAGISFWMKGDGTPNWGGMELIDAEDNRLRYQCEFSLSSTRWRKITVAWGDFLPFLPFGDFLDPVKGHRPSRIGTLRFGKQPWWFEWPAHSFTVDQVQLEPVIEVDTADYTPAGDPLARFKERFEHRRPISLFTMGDSLTSRYNYANRFRCWVDVLARKLMDHHWLEVSVCNAAIGGHQLTHGLLQIDRWLARCPQPDLITICFGGNDWADGMEPAQFEKRFRYAVDYVRRRTKGTAEVLLMTTAPCIENWEDERLRGLAQAVRNVAAEKNCALADIHAAFLDAGRDPATREPLYAVDKVHLGSPGMDVVADALFKVLVTGEPFPL